MIGEKQRKKKRMREHRIPKDDKMTRDRGSKEREREKRRVGLSESLRAKKKRERDTRGVKSVTYLKECWLQRLKEWKPEEP